MGFYLLVNVGALAGQLGMVYAEKNIGKFLDTFLELSRVCRLSERHGQGLKSI